MDGFFSRVSSRVAALAGRSLTFAVALGLLLVWLGTGRLFSYSDTWQLVANTATSLITFLMVFLIQSAQNRDGAAIQAKLDELIRSVAAARNSFIGIEQLTEAQLLSLRQGLAREAAAVKLSPAS
jgi:hypothetical protein